MGQRILVVGETGYGKRTLILRMLSDWSTPECGGYLGPWKLVFFVPCRDYLTYRNLCGWVKEEIELAASVVPESESQTLFLLDGLDELNSEWPTEIVIKSLLLLLGLSLPDYN